MKLDDFRLPTTYSTVECKCGEVLHFHHNFPAICNRCGHKVYPTELWRFRDLMKKTLIKRKRGDYEQSISSR